MALKRKRSSPGLRAPLIIDGGTISFNSNPNPLSFFFPSCKAIDGGFSYQKPEMTYPPSPTSSDMYNNDERYSSSRDLDSRTRKRYRNTRPTETDVHASTLQRLYDAQRHPTSCVLPTPPPEVQQGGLTVITTATRPIRTQRGTLHNFWKISVAPPKEPDDAEAMEIDSTFNNSIICEDCDSLISPEFLGAGETMSVMEERIGCQGCSRRVCQACAIHVSWEQRVCLSCANES